MSESAVKLTPFIILEVEVDNAIEIGQVPAGFRRVVPITGGRFEGERMRGTVLPGGADWNFYRESDSTIHIWARYTLKTDDGVLIGIINEGIIHANADAALKVITAAPLAPGETWHSRTRPVFEAPQGRYAWLNAAVFVGELRYPPRPNMAWAHIWEVA
jgi:hypothetical protein